MEDKETALDWVSSKKLHSTLDLKDGFFQIPLEEHPRQLKSIRTACRLFHYTKIPQGLKNSPGTFQRIVNEILGDLKGHWFWSYVDDDNVGSATAKNHQREMSL